MTYPCAPYDLHQPASVDEAMALMTQYPDALANAIHDAIGIRVRDLPLSPEKIHAAMQQARKAHKVAAAPIAEAGR